MYRDMGNCELWGPIYAEALGTKLDKLNLEKGLARSTELCALLNVIEMKRSHPLRALASAKVFPVSITALFLFLCQIWQTRCFLDVTIS